MSHLFMSRRSNPRLKKAFSEQSYTVEQAQELMKCARDPVYFITNYVFIKHPVRGQIKFSMYDYQQNMVRQFEKNRYNIVLASRQVGKTETSAAYLLWYALFNEEKMVLILSNKSDGAKEIISKIQNAYEELPHWLKPGIDDDSWNKHECRFDNKSRILAGATSADSARGLAISLLYLDEFAFVKTHLQEEFWTSVLPTLSCLSGDTLIFTQDGLKEIEEFHKEKNVGDYFEIKGLATWGIGGRERVSHGYVSPESETQIITNLWGMEVEATLKHPFWVAGPDGPFMKPNQELSEKDYIRVDSGMNMWGNNTLKPEHAYMLGGYIAEGWTQKKHTTGKAYSILVSNTDDEFRDVYLNSNLIKEFTQHSQESHKLVCSSLELVETFESWGVDVYAKCYEKTTPKTIFTSSKDTVTNYLAGLFDGDGSITDRSINLTSTSKKLLKETQLLLLNMGIISRVYINDGTKKRPRRIAKNNSVTQTCRDSYSLNIPLSQYELFKQNIPIRIQRKIDKLNHIISNRKQDDYKQFTIPCDVITPTIRKILKECNLTIGRARTEYNIRLDKILDGKSGRVCTNQKFNLFSDMVKKENSVVWEKHKSFWDGYLVKTSWVKIKKMTPSYQKKTYDFTVPGSHSFLQSGFMGSNTGGSCIISSTPNGNSNRFAQMWREANNDGEFVPTHVPWNAPPGRDEDFKKQQISILGKRKWLQEYECCHGDTLIELSNSDGTRFVKVPICMAYEALERDVDIFDMNPGILTGKYVVSPLDGKKYCRCNGQFFKHIKSYGYCSYQDFFESLFPAHIKYCGCGNRASFKNASMSYYSGCGEIFCRNRNISSRKKKFTKKDWQVVADRYRKTMSKKEPDEIREIIERRTKNGHANCSYKKSVTKRRKTCTERHGSSVYNNPSKISYTKKNWTKEKKEEFLSRLKESLGGRWLNDYHDEKMYKRRRKTLEESGSVVPIEALSEWELYRNEVRNLTKRNYRKFKKIINPNNLPRGNGRGKYHLDHIIPVLYGFLNDVPVEEMAGVDNLQMLLDKDNRKKSYKYEGVYDGQE